MQHLDSICKVYELSECMNGSIANKYGYKKLKTLSLFSLLNKGITIERGKLAGARTAKFGGKNCKCFSYFTILFLLHHIWLFFFFFCTALPFFLIEYR